MFLTTFVSSASSSGSLPLTRGHSEKLCCFFYSSKFGYFSYSFLSVLGFIELPSFFFALLDLISFFFLVLLFAFLRVSSFSSLFDYFVFPFFCPWSYWIILFSFSLVYMIILPFFSFLIYWKILSFFFLYHFSSLFLYLWDIFLRECIIFFVAFIFYDFFFERERDNCQRL